MPFYSFGSPRKISAASYIYYAQGCLHPDRVMQEHDFVYMLNGQWEIFQGREAFFMENDDVLILHAGQHHFGVRDCLPGTQTIYFHISAGHKDTFQCGKETPSEGALLPPLIHCGGRPRVKLLFQELVSIWHEPAPRRDRKLDTLFELLLLELEECCGQEAHFHDEILLRSVSLLAQNPQKFFTAGELSDLLGICARTLNRRFQLQYGKTFYQYQMEEKMHMVQQFLLDYPEAKLQTVAVNFGFYDEFHLNRAFRKYTGMPPGQYRKANITNFPGL